MAIQVNYLDNGFGSEMVASDIVTGEEIIKALKEIYNDQHLNKLKYRIIDRTNCTEYRVYPEEIEKIADMDDKASIINPNLMIAVISTTSLQHGMTSMWQSYLKNNVFITKNFPDRISADKWIKSYIEINK